jgi:sterol carrier protein 2
LAKNSIQGGQADCVLALGFEKMQRGSLSSSYNDRANPMEKHVEVMSNVYELTASPMTAVRIYKLDFFKMFFVSYF